MTAIAERAASLIERERAVPLSLSIRDRSGDASPSDGTLFELTSRGDRVPVVIWRPDGTDASPLVVLQYGAGGSIDAGHRAAVHPLLAAGLAVATVDWPLHGGRASVKLSERLLTGLDRAGPDPNGANLVDHFVLQSVLDVVRGLDAAQDLDGISAGPVGLVGVGVGAGLATLAAAVDPRVGALAIAPTHHGDAGASLDIVALLEAGSPKPVLLLTSDAAPALAGDELEALLAACPGEASHRAVDDPIEPLGPAAAAATAEFLKDALS